MRLNDVTKVDRCPTQQKCAIIGPAAFWITIGAVVVPFHVKSAYPAMSKSPVPSKAVSPATRRASVGFQFGVAGVRLKIAPFSKMRCAQRD